MSATLARNAPCACGSGKRHKQCCGRLAGVVATPPRPSTQLPAEARSQLGAALASGRWQEAGLIANALLDRFPAAGELWQALAVAQTQQGQDSLKAWRSAVLYLPDDAASHHNLANGLARLGRIDEAIDHWRRAAELKPNLIEAHLHLGNALQSAGRLDEALAAFRRALSIDPTRIEGLLGAGGICLLSGRLEEAGDAYRRAHAIQPGSAEILVNLGAAVRGQGRVDEAIGLFRKALMLNPTLAEAHAAIGTAFRLEGLSEQAVASLRRALELKPDLIDAILALAETHADGGDFEGAEQEFWRAIAVSPDSPEAWSGIPRVRRMTGDDADWLEGAQRVIATAPPPRQRLHLHYALGKYHDDRAQYAEAFANFEQANKLSSALRAPHDQALLARAVDTTLATYDAPWLASKRGQGDPSPVPVFIVGMPRSGTTLLEQMLAAHPGADGAGELSFWGEAAARRHDLPPAETEPLDGLARAYLERLRSTRREALRVIDKMPANLMHLGLIHAALPNARIIHMRRDPIDTCLSIYFQHFEPTLTYANDLADLADYCRRCDQVMAHWRRILPSGSMIEVDYEAMVTAPRATLEGVLRFIDLAWDDRCLAFHTARRTVITASKWQARQKINTGSIGRWRRYEAFIEPLLGLGSGEQTARLQDASRANLGQG